MGGPGPAKPRPRERAAFVYDAARDEFVMFGGRSGLDGMADTWVLRGNEWVRMDPEVSPPVREGHSMVYDAARGEVVLYGGLSRTGWAGGVYLDDTWTWDGDSWTEENPDNVPPIRVWQTMAYDAARGVVVMFGGATEEGLVNDTWIWDGDNWSLQRPTDAPDPRLSANMAYDALREEIVLFSGADGGDGNYVDADIPHSMTHDTWTWDGTTWEQQDPATSPPPRIMAGTTFDEARGELVLFGGERRMGHNYNDTWVWDGTTWTERHSSVRPSVRARLESQMAYNSAEGYTLFFGGYESCCGGEETHTRKGGQASEVITNDLWAWDGERWAKVQIPAGGAWTKHEGIESPPARSFANATYDAAREEVVLFGGDGTGMPDCVVLSYCPEGPLNDTWIWDGEVWSEKTPGVSPPGRRNPVMAYHEESQKTVLFGGGFPNSDTWTWDGSSWDLAVPLLSPPPRDDAAMAADANGNLVMFGGYQVYGGAQLGDTWTWDGVTWKPHAVPVGPLPRDHASMAYDPLTRQTVLFGGYSYESGILGDTWVWDGSSWTEVQPNGQGPERYAHSLAYDPSVGKIVMFGGVAEVAYDDDFQAGFVTFGDYDQTNDVWYWEGTGWVRQDPPTEPNERAYSVFVGDAERKNAVLFGGQDNYSGGINDTWTWDGRVAGSDLAITTTGVPDAVPSGSPATYELLVENRGPETTPVTLEVFLPTDGVVVVRDPSQATCHRADAEIECDLGALASGETATVEVSVTAGNEPIMRNWATVRGAATDFDPTNNSVKTVFSVTGVNVPTPPSAPEGLTARATSDSEVELSWTDPAKDESGFKLERSVDQASWARVASLRPDTITYSDTGLAADTTYHYRLRAYNRGGDSGFSNIASVTTEVSKTGGSGPAPPPRGTYPATPNDPYFGPGTGLVVPQVPLLRSGVQWGPQRIQAPSAWQEIQATGYRIDVAVLDSGVDLSHEDLACPGKLRVVAGSDPVSLDNDPTDQLGHGTHVAGIIGACTNNGIGVAGIAPDARIVPIRVLNARGSGTNEQLIAGINKAVEAGADVINMSLSYGDISGTDLFDVAAIDVAIEAAAAEGVVLVASAGNDRFPLCEYPALAAEIICVGATDTRDLPAHYSTFANKSLRGGAAVVAPGGSGQEFCDINNENILSLKPRGRDRCAEGLNGYEGLDGTSMAAPHVAGVAALVYDRLGGSRSPENAQAVIDAITTTAKDLGVKGKDPVYGSGRVDARAAVRAVVPQAPTPPAAPSELTANAVSSSRVNLSWTDNSDEFGFQIERSTDGVNWAEIGVVGENATAYPDVGLEASTTYHYRLRAYNSGGFSDYSGTAAATTQEPSGGGTPTPTPTPTPSVSTEPARGSYPLLPTDPIFHARGGQHAGQWAFRKINAPAAWQVGRSTGFGISVAVIDSGVDLQHEDLTCPGKLKVVPGSDVIADGDGPNDTDGHGTHVAGIIGACTNNNKGVAGLAPDSTLMPFQVFNRNGGTFDEVVNAIRLATDAGAHVINMSIGPLIPMQSYAPGWKDLEEAIAYAQNNGVVVVAAAGNQSMPLCNQPGLSQNVVCVGATDSRDLKSWYSTFPNKLDMAGPSLVAPGGSGQPFCDYHSENIVSTYATEFDDCNETYNVFRSPGYRGLDGTSMAAPHVAGVAALVYDRLDGERNTDNATKVIEALTSTAVDLGASGYDPVYGSGRINALAAVCALGPSCDGGTQQPIAPAAPTALSATAKSATEIDLTWTDGSGNEDGFTLERSTDGSTWSEIGSAAADATTYSDSGLTAATTYHYRVRAFNSAGNSDYSNTASATTRAATDSGPGAGARGSYPEAPNDAYFGPGRDIRSVSALKIATQWAPQKIEANRAWQEDQATGYGIQVAVLDTGVDLNHEDLSCPGKLEVVGGSDIFSGDNEPDDDNGHGTHVAGIIAACTNNGKGIAGIAPDAAIMPIRVLGPMGHHDEERLIAGIERATAAGAEVINMSLAFPTETSTDIFDFSAVDAAIDAAAAQGVVIVASAANDSFPLCNYPALAEDIICVGATDARDYKAWYSNFANKARGGAAVVAPGGSGQVLCDVHSENILSLIPKGLDKCNEGLSGYTGYDGTSMAAPHVAGVAALVYDRLGGQRSDANATKVINALTSTARDLGVPGYDPVYGSGLVDALEAVRSIQIPNLLFSDDSATSAQHSDQAHVAAQLSRPDGSSMTGAEVTFTLAGETDKRSFSATTDQSGLASSDMTISEPPGTYTLTARYAGDEGYAPTRVATDFTVSADDSATALVASGYGGGRSLTSTVSDQDAPDAGLAGVTVTFSSDGETIGEAVTDEAGVATFDPAAPHDKGAHTYGASFAGNDFYLGSSDDAVTGEGVSRLGFTPASAGSGQYSDDAHIEVQLQDEGGDPIEAAAVTFELSGPGGSRSYSATTDASGIGASAATLELVPGTYTLAARYGGLTGHHTSAAVSSDFVIAREETTLALDVSGKGAQRRLIATLRDHDAATAGIGSRVIGFYSGSELLGTATTDANGLAWFDPPPRYQGGRRTYKAVFEGDDFYVRSSDEKTT